MKLLKLFTKNTIKEIDEIKILKKYKIYPAQLKEIKANSAFDDEKSLYDDEEPFNIYSELAGYVKNIPQLGKLCIKCSCPYPKAFMYTIIIALLLSLTVVDILSTLNPEQPWTLFPSIEDTNTTVQEIIIACESQNNTDMFILFELMYVVMFYAALSIRKKASKYLAWLTILFIVSFWAMNFCGWGQTGTSCCRLCTHLVFDLYFHLMSGFIIYAKCNLKDYMRPEDYESDVETPITTPDKSKPIDV